MQRLRIAITMGDPNGIGPEILLRCLQDRYSGNWEPIVVASPSVVDFYADRLGLPLDAGVHQEKVGEDFTPEPGSQSAEAGHASMLAVQRAVDLCLEGRADAMVTCPISKEAISRAGYDVPGHTEFIARRCRADEYVMMLVSGELRVALVTAHLPLSKVAAGVTAPSIISKLTILDAALRRDYGIAHPSIAVLGLNPHAGDGGVLGSEELKIIAPAMKQSGCRVSGPFPADGFFGSGSWKEVDAVLAMYHDQGLVPFKALSFGTGVNHTAGLPIVRTSPDHGTAFDLAGKGVARPDSLGAAITLAAEIARRRAS